MLMKYPGSKLQYVRQLWIRQPVHFREFRSPTCGNAPLLWLLPTDTPRWINDKDEMVIKYFIALRDENDFIKQFQKLRKAGLISIFAAERIFNDCIQRIFDYRDPVAYLYVRRLAHLRLVGFHRRCYACFCGENIPLTKITADYMRKARKTMQGVRVTQLDYKDVLSAPADQCWSFVDVPYYVRHHSSPIYLHDFTLTDRKELKEVLLSLNPSTHQVLMTVEHSELSRNEYELDSRFETSVRRYPRSMMNHIDDIVPGAELFVSNGYFGFF